MDVKERMEVLAKSKASQVLRSSSRHRHPGATLRVDIAEAEGIVAGWPAAPRQVAMDAVERYGPPNEATPTQLIWHDNGPWKRTIISADERPHAFPTPHTDYITQFVEYAVPLERLEDIARFDGSVVPNRTTGEVFAACDMEAMNILSLNLMHDIVQGRLTVEEARSLYADEAAAYMLGRPAPYTERLRFEAPDGGTADTDESMIADAMLAQMVEKVKDVAR